MPGGSGSSAPFASHMKLGQGFNSYTQEVCIDDAVLITPRIEKSTPVSRVRSIIPSGALDHTRRVSTFNVSELDDDNSSQTSHKAKEVHYEIQPNGAEIAALATTSQIVQYSSRYVENMQDIMDSMNISSASTIKYGNMGGGGSASFVNEDKVNSADINYIISCRVTNEVSTIPDDMVFNPVESLDAGEFIKLYGDCFISGFLEGGRFDAVVSIKVDDKSKLRSIRAAADAEIAVPAVPGMTVDTKTSMGKDKTSIFKDTETTISVNYHGGGQVKDPNAKWDLKVVMESASRFPFLVQHEAQRTSAILTPYTALRTFMEYNVNREPKQRIAVKDYTLCKLYTHDLFSAYMAYRRLWIELSETIKNMSHYKPRKATAACPNPIGVDPISLNEARLLARKNLVLISKEVSALETHPELADLNEKGNMRPMPQAPPAILATRMPVSINLLDEEKDAYLDAMDCASLGRLLRNPDVYIHPLVGDMLATDCSSNRGKHKTFCTLDPTARIPHAPGAVRFQGHKHTHFAIFADFRKHSRSSERYLSAIGTSYPEADGRYGGDGMQRHVGRLTDDESYWSMVGDLIATPVMKVRIEHSPGTGRIGGIELLSQDGIGVTSWKQYGQAKIERPMGMNHEEQTAPEETGWSFLGFWGHRDAVVITQIGTLWRKT